MRLFVALSMLVVAWTWYVRCDVCGDACEISTQSAMDARALAMAGGYERRKIEGRMLDLCPGHVRTYDGVMQAAGLTSKDRVG